MQINILHLKFLKALTFTSKTQIPLNGGNTVAFGNLKASMVKAVNCAVVMYLAMFAPISKARTISNDPQISAKDAQLILSIRLMDLHFQRKPSDMCAVHY